MCICVYVCVVRACVRYRVDSKLRASVIVSYDSCTRHQKVTGGGLVLIHFIHITKAGGGRMGGERERV